MRPVKETRILDHAFDDDENDDDSGKTIPMAEWG